MNIKKYAYIIISVLLMLTYSLQAQQKFDREKQIIPSTKVQKLLKKEKSIVVLDVRTPHEFKAGHLKGAININVADRNFKMEINKLEKTKQTYLVYCRTQNRSSIALQYMLQKGFKNVYLMSDGFSGWSKNRLPIQK